MLSVGATNAAWKGHADQKDEMRLNHPGSTSKAATAVAKANRKVGTKPEALIRALLHRRGYRFRKNYYIKLEKGRGIRPDIVFSKHMLAVFIDGCFWHCCPEHRTIPRKNTEYWIPKLERNVTRDHENERRLREAGWAVLRIWEHVPAEEAVEEIISHLSSYPRTQES